MKKAWGQELEAVGLTESSQETELTGRGARLLKVKVQPCASGTHFLQGGCAS